jgi:hypothetical protein
VSKPMRNLPGLRPNSSWYGLEGGVATKRSPGIAPATTSKMAAASCTERVSTCSQTLPRNPPLRAGPSEMRPRDGLGPTRPQQLAGIRMEPVPSLPHAIHGGQATHDTIDAHTMAVWLHGSLLPQASVDPVAVRRPPIPEPCACDWTPAPAPLPTAMVAPVQRGLPLPRT